MISGGCAEMQWPCTRQHARPRIRTEGAFKRMRDRQPKVVLQRAGPASSLSFSYCSCERRRARGRIINAIFSSRSLPPSARGKLSFADVDNGDRMYGPKRNFSVYPSLALSITHRVAAAGMERVKERSSPPSRFPSPLPPPPRSYCSVSIMLEKTTRLTSHGHAIMTRVVELH